MACVFFASLVILLVPSLFIILISIHLLCRFFLSILSSSIIRIVSSAAATLTIHVSKKKTTLEYILESTSQYILWNIIYERKEKIQKKPVL